MPNYRRAFVPGGTFFFTVVTQERMPILCTDLGRELLRTAIEACRDRWPFEIDAFILLPDHLHSIWTLPPEDSDFSRRWAFIKKEFTKQWIREGGNEAFRTESRVRNRRRGVWQRRFWEHTCRDELDCERHVEYAHYNPVKHGLVQCPHLWPYSTFHRYVASGTYDEKWACRCSGSPAEVPDFTGLDLTAME